MIGVKVTDGNVFQVFKVGPGLAETQKNTTACIDKKTRPPIDPDQVSGRGPAIIRNGPA